MAALVGACQSDPAGILGPEAGEPVPSSHSGSDEVTADQTAFDPNVTSGTARIVWHTVPGALSYRLVLYATSSDTSLCSVDSPEYGAGVVVDLPSVAGEPYGIPDHRYLDESGLPPGIYCLLIAANIPEATFVTTHLAIAPPPVVSQISFDPGTNTGTARVVWGPVIGTSGVVMFLPGVPYGSICKTSVYDPELGFDVQPEPSYATWARVGSDHASFDLSGLSLGMRCILLHVTSDYVARADFIVSAVSPNHPPVASWSLVPADPGEGEAIAFDASAMDEDGDLLTFDWDFGDGSGSTEEDPSHAYAEDGSYTVALSVSDGADSVSIQNSIVIANLPPVLGDVGVSSALVPKGDAFTLTAAFDDAGVADTHLGNVDWGDGTSTAVGTDFGTDPATSPVTVVHTYADPGVYEITVLVTDDDGDSDTEVYRYLIVYDPSAGFVTGGGWIEYAGVSCPALCGGGGIGRFGFASKYQKGASIPTGTTRFEFQAGTLVFSSATYDWLVVSGSGKRAQFKGYGTVNDAGWYGFLLTAIDGVVDGTDDRFRIKIWDTATGETVFDNQWGAAIDGDAATALDGVHGGGSVVIHRKR